MSEDIDDLLEGMPIEEETAIEGPELDEQQLAAIDLCLNTANRIVAVTGAAGTGKTTIIQQVVAELRRQDKVVAVAAPTGKAARRIKEATGIEAVTCHRLLEYPKPGERDPKTGKVLNPSHPKRGANNPLNVDVVIVDEYAMVDHELDRNIIDALGRAGRLLVFGDLHQLPPVSGSKVKDPKSPFEHHLNRASIILEKVYRQSADSGILPAADNIRRGLMPRQAPDFRFLITDYQIRKLREHVIDAQENGIDYGSIRNQIICVTKKKWLGTAALNSVLRNIFNPSPTVRMELPRHSWDAEEQTEPLIVGIGDKVVCTENSYDMRNFMEREEPTGSYDEEGKPIMSEIPCPESRMMLNGEIGIITDLTADMMVVDVGDRLVEIPAVITEVSTRDGSHYDVELWKRIDLAYALTTHKCQGSEFDHIIYVIDKSQYFMLERRNFYTAVTRARKGVLIIANQRALTAATRKKVD